MTLPRGPIELVNDRRPDAYDQEPNWLSVLRCALILEWQYRRRPERAARVWLSQGLGGAQQLFRGEPDPAESFSTLAFGWYFRPGRYLIAINGTETLRQWGQHLWGALPRKRPGGEGNVFGFTQFQADLIAERFKRVNLDNVPDLRSIDVVGHSYGGSVAYLVASRLKEYRPEASVVAFGFGAPRCLSADANETKPDQYWRLEHEFDMITELPTEWASLVFPDAPDDSTDPFDPFIVADLGKDLIDRARAVRQARKGSAWEHRGQGITIDRQGFAYREAPEGGPFKRYFDGIQAKANLRRSHSLGTAYRPSLLELLRRLRGRERRRLARTGS